MAHDLDAFTRAFLNAALWAGTDDNGEPLEDRFTLADVADATVADAAADCADFQAAHAALLDGADPAQAGHDFYLTRNRHGAGFWDRDRSTYPADPEGRALTDAAHAFGPWDFVVGDDGMLYHHN